MKIAVLLSGGVDSSVSLGLLKDQGHQLEAFYLKIWLEDDMVQMGDCPWEDDLQYAKSVCRKLNVPLKIISLQHEYFERVVNHAVGELKIGRTPSPDIMCNERIKFGAFFDKIDQTFEKVATGHYGIIEQKGGEYFLKKAKDTLKDQTYFLSHLNQKQLGRLLFPVGEYTKKEVRALAKKYALPNQNRKDSQGICFLGKIKYNDFVRHYLGESCGDIIDIDTKKKVGIHKGFWFYTIGQRQGLGLSGGPWYVVQKDVKTNQIFISNKLDLDSKAVDSFGVINCHWFSGKAPQKSDLDVKIRHGETITSCALTMSSCSAGHVKMHALDAGVAPGQFAVFYDGDYCVGGGMITK